MTEAQIRSKIVFTAESYLGCKESNGSHKKIIDLYNSHKPLARGYKVKYTNAWCATFVSAMTIKCGLTGIMPTECSCSKMIELYRAKGRWKEDDGYTPAPGDLIMYDWEDSGKGDNKGAPNHVGIVVSVSGGKIKVIEGNYNNAVCYREIAVNFKYIRGYCLPDYASIAEEESAKEPSTPSEDVWRTAKDSARSFSKALAGTYKVTASALNVRNGAGTSKSIMVAIPKGTAVRCYGYYSSVLGVKWLYVQFTYKGVKYTGFASSRYLKK